MANTKISNLTSAAALTGSEVTPIVQSGSTVKATTQNIANLAYPNQSGNADKFIKTNGTTASWGSVDLSNSSSITGVLPTSNGGTGGTLPIANGGTGQTSANNAINALLPTQSGQSGKYLTTNGTNTSWATVSGGPLIYAARFSYISSAIGPIVPTVLYNTTGFTPSFATPGGGVIRVTYGANNPLTTDKTFAFCQNIRITATPALAILGRVNIPTTAIVDFHFFNSAGAAFSFGIDGGEATYLQIQIYP